MTQVQPATTTKNGTSKTALSAEMVENNEKVEKGLTRAEKNEFLEKISTAIELGPEAGEALPEIEVPRKVIEHFNRANMKDFNDTHFFVYHNVRVYEEGKRDMSKKTEKLTVEERQFGRRR